MASSEDVQVDALTMVGRVIVGVWAINFLLMMTNIVTYSGQRSVSFGLAVASVVILLLRRKS